MPQDSTYHLGSLPDSVLAKDSSHAIIVAPNNKNILSDSERAKDSLLAISIVPKTDPIVQVDNKTGQGLALEIYLFVLLGIIVVPITIKKIRLQISRKKLAKVLESKEIVFDSMLQHYSPYYKSLSANARERFMNSVLSFIEEKEFKYIDIEQEDIMPLLISAAAVQLTFGLEHYKMEYFENIYVVRNKYRFGFYTTPFEGHVSDDGIYLSWDNFVSENNDYTDGENVGLHELAHALAYVNFTVDEGRDDWFYNKFRDFSKVGRPIFERMQAGETNLLNNYAATNFNEFWAVCIETFFERSEKFRQQLPELYFAICSLLNQDPLTPAKIISLFESD